MEHSNIYQIGVYKCKFLNLIFFSVFYININFGVRETSNLYIVKISHVKRGKRLRWKTVLCIIIINSDNHCFAFASKNSIHRIMQWLMLIATLSLPLSLPLKLIFHVPAKQFTHMSTLYLRVSSDQYCLTDNIQ